MLVSSIKQHLRNEHLEISILGSLIKCSDLTMNFLGPLFLKFILETFSGIHVCIYSSEDSDISFHYLCVYLSYTLAVFYSCFKLLISYPPGFQSCSSEVRPLRTQGVICKLASFQWNVEMGKIHIRIYFQNNFWSPMN